MKLIVIKSNLKDGLFIIERAGGEHLNLPILKNFLFEAYNNKIKITATNLEIGVSYSINGKIIEEGKITTPLSIFSNIINNLPTERLNLEEKDGGLIIKTDNYEAIIQGMPHKDFPIIPTIKNQSEHIQVKSDILKEAFAQVILAAQFSDLRPELNSVLIDFSLDTIKLAATDSFRLSEKTIGSGKFESNHTKPFKLLIPLKTSQELLRILRDGE